MERFSRTILSALRKYIGDHPKDWGLFSDAVTYAYNTQVHRTTNIAPFELVLARAPRSIALQARPQLEQFGSPIAYYLKWQSGLKSLMKTANRSLRKEQARYKRNFDARLRKPKYDISVGSYVFLRKEQGTATEPKQKLAQVATGPYAVRQSDSNTVVIAIGDQEKRVSRDLVELAPSPMEHAPISGLLQALQFLSGREENQERDATESEDGPHTRTQRLEDEENLVSQNSSAEIPPDLQRSSNLEELEEANNLQEGEEGNGAHEPEDENAEYVIEKIIDHGYQDEEWILRVKWYGYGTKDAT